ncbi:MAG: hypothetical protein H6Q74_215 [Firmicutes bacterium]|nr:hypothetical protein [Bacillota bacterium]
MADLENDEIEEIEDPIVVMTDEEGNEYYYREELIIPVGEKRFAILVSIDVEDDGCDCSSCGGGCGCEDEEESDVFIARIDTDENGEETYIDPTDEEFEAVRQAYEELMEEDDEAE